MINMLEMVKKQKMTDIKLDSMLVATVGSDTSVRALKKQSISSVPTQHHTAANTVHD